MQAYKVMKKRVSLAEDGRGALAFVGTTEICPEGSFPTMVVGADMMVGMCCSVGDGASLVQTVWLTPCRGNTIAVGVL